jgi:hypothetical protein
VNLLPNQPFDIVLTPSIIQDPEYVWQRASGYLLLPDEFAHIVRQNWIEAFINRGSTNDDRCLRERLIELQLGYEQGQCDAALGIVIVNMNLYAWEGIDFTMDWGTAIGQDITGEPVNEVYDGSKWLTSVTMVAIDEWTDIDLDARDEYSEQAVDQSVEIFVDFGIGRALDGMKNTKCTAPETLAELGSTGVKGIKSLLDRAAERSDGRPGIGWAPTYAR